MRKPIIAGNWKMNMTPAEAVRLIEELKPLIQNEACTVVLCPSACCLFSAREALSGSEIRLGAQNVHWAPSGAYTGEVSVNMLKELGVEYVIIGHSERRQYFGETDETVNKRAHAALSGGITPIICVGETLLEREQGLTNEIVCTQTEKALLGFTSEEIEKIVLAYEPIWAIGTGKTATSADANETIGVIRNRVRELFDSAAESVRILYGGSMKGSNAHELMAAEEINGGLIGGASLKAADFAAVVHYDK